MSRIVAAADIAKRQDEGIVCWKQDGVLPKETDFLGLVLDNHSFNYRLWVTEDRARRDDMGYEFVYRAKRDIDYFNQQRNNYMEAMDTWLYDALKPSTATDCPVHSETPGMMVDRLSILALKIYHMNLQQHRDDVDDKHRAHCEQKKAVLLAQRGQLVVCLQALCDAGVLGERTFKVYHQFKMYNDPTLNPELYKK